MGEIVKYENKEIGVESKVFQNSFGAYGVIITDTDANETLPGVKFFKEQIQAEEFARKAVQS